MEQRKLWVNLVIIVIFYIILKNLTFESFQTFKNKITPISGPYGSQGKKGPVGFRGIQGLGFSIDETQISITDSLKLGTSKSIYANDSSQLELKLDKNSEEYSVGIKMEKFGTSDTFLGSSYIDCGGFKLNNTGIDLHGDLEVDGDIYVKYNNEIRTFTDSIPSGLIFPFYFVLADPLLPGFYNLRENESTSVKVYVKKNTLNLYDIVYFKDDGSRIDRIEPNKRISKNFDGSMNLIITIDGKNVSPAIPLGWEIVDDLNEKFIYHSNNSSSDDPDKSTKYTISQANLPRHSHICDIAGSHSHLQTNLDQEHGAHEHDVASSNTSVNFKTGTNINYQFNKGKDGSTPFQTTNDIDQINGAGTHNHEAKVELDGIHDHGGSTSDPVYETDTTSDTVPIDLIPYHIKLVYIRKL